MAIKGKRVTVDLSPQSTIELERLQELTGLGTSDLLRWSVTMFRMYANAKAEGKEFRIVNTSDPQDQVRVEFPIHIQTDEDNQRATTKVKPTQKVGR